MICAWKQLIRIFPTWLQNQLAQYEHHPLQDIRMRINSPPELIVSGKSIWLSHPISQEDLSFCISIASRYSPWAAATIEQGYLTVPGGHRIGVCGEAIIKNGHFCGIRTVTSICVRIARDFPGIAGNRDYSNRSILILGAPGWGKTTLLRDIARNLANRQEVCVIDERQELFPSGFQTGKRMDILIGCPKTQGITCALRTMGPEIIAVDEITDPEDCCQLLQAQGCGVKLLATAHASDLNEFNRRTVYAPLREHRVFDTILVLRRDKSFSVEEAR